MPPPVETFTASQLPFRVQATASGKRRKGEEIRLEECELLEMVQYSCWLEDKRKDVIKCKPIVKLFRKYDVQPLSIRLDVQVLTAIHRCAGNLTVETTALEGAIELR